MTTYYVDPDGDNSDGLSIATAKTTIAGGFAAVTTGGGHTLWVKPARYREKNLKPTNPGVTGSNNTIIGDTDGAIFGTAGYVTVDGSTTAGNVGAYMTAGGSGNYTVEDNAWAYWNMKKIHFTGAMSVSVGASSDGTASDSNVFEDLVIDTYASDVCAYVDFQFTIPDTAGKAIVWRRCVFRNVWGTTYNNASWGSYANVASDRTNPHLIFERCVFIGPSIGAFYTGRYAHIHLQQCSFFAPGTAATSYVYHGTGSAAGRVIEETDCVLVAYYPGSITVSPTLTRRKLYVPDTVSGGTYDAAPHIFPVPMLFPESPIIESDASVVGTYPDILQTSAKSGSYDEPGAQEWVAGEYPTPPTMIMTTASAAPAASSTGVSRSRIVNAGGI